MGSCGRFRFQVIPDIRVGVVHLERLRPWPACANPDTGRQWSQDMKDKIFEVRLGKAWVDSGFPYLRSEQPKTAPINQLNFKPS